MKLTAFFPSASTLQRDVLVPQDGGVDRLTLSVPHSVTGRIGGREVFGEASIKYKIDFARETTFGERLDLGSNTFIGIQSTEYLASRLGELKPRTSYAVQHLTTGKFDMRSLLYVLGQAFAGGSGTTTFAEPRAFTQVATLGQDLRVPAVGEVMLAPDICQTSNQMATLMGLARAAGVVKITFLGDTLLSTDGYILTGRALAKFALRVATNVLKMAAECNVFGAHKVAFLAGMTQVMTLHAHSDEGGWVRRLLRNVSYPPSIGLIGTVGTEFTGLPLRESVAGTECLRMAVGEYLECMALLHVADVTVNGKTSVYIKDDPGVKPSCFGPFVNEMATVLDEWRSQLCARDNQHDDSVSDMGAYRKWIESNDDDRHFDVDTLVPWWIVETAPLLSGEYAGYWVPASHGAVINMPLIGGDGVAHNGMYVDGAQRPSLGTDMVVKRSKKTYREEGIHYLLDRKYNDKGYLGSIMNGEGPSGQRAASVLFSPDGEYELGRARWVTPDNPLPSPVEGLTPDEAYYKYTYHSLKLGMSISDVLTGTVESRLGVFRVDTDVAAGEVKTNRELKRHLKNWLRPDPHVPARRKMVFVGAVQSGAAPPTRVELASTEDDARGPKVAWSTREEDEKDDEETTGQLVRLEVGATGIRTKVPAKRASQPGEEAKRDDAAGQDVNESANGSG